MTNQLVKVLLLLPRKKENEEIATEQMQHRKCYRKVWSTPEEREVRIKELEAVASLYPEYKWRIYETVNWRDLRKAYFEFEKRKLEWQRSDKTNEMKWLQYYNSEWVSNLMRPECKDKKEQLFIIDKDDRCLLDEFTDMMDDLKIEIVEAYITPGGYHYLVKPFDITSITKNKRYGLWKDWNAEVHKDGLRLVKVIDKK